MRAFLADKNPNKRSALIDSLLERKEFTELWVMKWAELLQIRSSINNNQPPFYKNALLYYNWLSERIGKNVPINEIVVELLAATGGTVSSPAVNFYQTELDQLKLTENVAQVFMGMRIQCAQCHNHPFDRWTMDDYYGFKAFFAQIGRKQTDDPREVIVFNSKGGESRHFLDKRRHEARSSVATPLNSSPPTTAARCSPTGWPRQQSLLRAQHRQHHLGALQWHRHCGTRG
jgi:hypothetical protein